MDLDSQINQLSDLLPAGAAVQLASLAAAVGGVLLAALLVIFVACRIERRRAWARTGPADAAVGDAAENGDDGDGAVAGDPADAAACQTVSSLRLLVVAVLAVCLMPAAAAVRQLWPHPDLGWPMIACWFAVLLPVLVTWLVLGRTMPAGSSTRRSRG